MIAPPTADEALTQTDAPQQTLLAEQLIEFANEAFVFADISRTRHASKAEQSSKCVPCPSQAYFADVEPPPLAPLHLKNTRVVPSREQILPLLPKGGVCIEIGTHTGCFGRQILSVLEPAKLHLCDQDFNLFDDGPFATAIETGIVELHEGGTAEYLAGQADRHFDLIYIHPGPSYMAAARALEQAGRKIKDDGCIICSNYTTYLPLEGVKCGVARAVNEFCHTGCFEMIYLALHSLGCQDAALHRRAEKSEAESLGALLDAPDTNTFLPDVWDYLIEKYQIHSVLDMGAGAGWSTKWFAQRGIYTLGVEDQQEALDKSQCRANIVKHDYRSGPFVPSMLLDLAWCAGLVEQIEEEFIPNFMASFRSCQYVCLTHAEAGQPGHHHVNCQSTEYWVKKMNEFGFDYDNVETAHLRSTDKHKSPRGRRTLTFFKKRN
jgi:predicted O-methyltransferase YrrM